MKHVDLVGTRRYFFIGSGAVLLVSIVLLAVLGLRPGIEFTSGTTTLIHFDQNVSQEDLRAVYADLGHSEARIQSTGPNEYLIRTAELEVPEGSFTEVDPTVTATDSTTVGPNPLPEVGTVTLGGEGATGDIDLHEATAGDVCTFGEVAATEPVGTDVTVNEVFGDCANGVVYRVSTSDGKLGLVAATDTRDFRGVGEEAGAPSAESSVTQNAGERTEIEQRLFDEFGAFEVREFASVSAVVSSVAVRNAAAAVVIASLFIMGYVAFAFSSVPRPFRYAACAIAALVHDVIVVLGAFALFGAVFGIEINLMFITGLLTVIGFSVHDSIVVFDRIRENVRAAPSASLAENVNSALLQTMARSMNTSITVLVTVAAMLALGGSTIQEFLLVILVGVIAGTYSSIGIASQLLVAWEEGDLARIFGRNRSSSEQTA
ncbi:MAG: protein translocase subunit SecF [Dehalococcoidia bacterium]|nr:protein translocase subunit SecF [Dehalococcoidia bacterium]MCB9492378.1 protein translocase subunit SecF [Dehalococcoidia bacterium]